MSIFNDKSAQVTVFIIIAIILVVGVISYFFLKDKLGVGGGIPQEVEPVYNSFLSCIDEYSLVGISLLESQGGYIYLPTFETGSTYMPFSSQLDFLGNPIPYWYYVSGNNIQKEQVPTKSEMEEDLSQFLEGKIRDCVLDEYYDQGFEIILGEPDAETSINDDSVDLKLNMDISIKKGEDSFYINKHESSVDSKLGALYDSARKVYAKEQNELFLENFAVDILRLYAPVDGVELTCSPKIWYADEVFSELQEAIEGNNLALRAKGSDYELSSDENKYFVLDLPIDSGMNVRFLNSRNWTYSFEVNPSEGNLLMASPVGTQQGLGVLGFCYTPYHFVYDIKYPILVQIYSEDEIFQFPMAVVLLGNNPREPYEGAESLLENNYEICSYKNTEIDVYTFDTLSNSVEAEISHECFGSVCNIGSTSEGYLRDSFPQCVNGYIIAKADGYEDESYLFSTVQPGVANILMKKLYELEVELNLDGSSYNKEAVITFISNSSSRTIFYPEQKRINLSDGQYEIQVYIYKNSSLRLDSESYEQCIEVPQDGIGGIFGFTKQKCFDIEIPPQIISSSLSGGGKQNYYILEYELQSSNTIQVDANSLPTPTSLEQLQNNYLLFEDSNLGVSFK